MSDKNDQQNDKQNEQQQDAQHPGMNPDPAERGKELGRANAQGGESVGTGGHGYSGSGGNQPVGGKHAGNTSGLTEEQLHPGMNPDPAERGRELGHQNAHGGHSVGTGGHGTTGANLKSK
ncbi:unnamed protein product [Didymodactylos carnosus]|uniref:Uncharacterized protein n=2 Tax=Didymodactylos carnosus TaxID=1234261 RepID=A0A8S2EZS8_9BILA|nr:unnamed protein product [Didymodactylos carnosus]CAF4165190.1 unnamed protein product [Didymodactylos carnosus]